MPDQVLDQEKWAALAEWTAGVLRPPPKLSVSEWAESQVILPPPGPSPGRFRLAGREFCREIIDTFGAYGVHDCTVVSASQAGKSTSLLVGLAWVVANNASPVLAVYPNDVLARSVSETRWEPILRATPSLERMIPSGSARHSFKTGQQILGGSTVNWVGSNSPANLASRPIRVLLCDEVDKFAESTEKEGDAVSLALARTKSFANYQHWFTSTPTTIDGRIWQLFMSGDMRRYEVPCPHCRKDVIFAWSKQFTLLPLTDREAFMTWDPAAKRPDGSWDLDRVFSTAHLACPHCKGQIRTEHKTTMIRDGKWVATYPHITSKRSWHISSLYANAVQTTFGALAVKFLQAKLSPEGLQSFVTNELGEPWEEQGDRLLISDSLVTGEEAAVPVGENTCRYLTVDVQAKEPFFWWVIREWAKSGDSRLVACGHCDQWEQVAQVQRDHALEDWHVFVDCGFEQTIVFKECLARGKLIRASGVAPTHRGWMPMKGQPKETGWIDPKSKLPRLWTTVKGALERRGLILWVLYFNSPAMRDVLARLRKHETKLKWQVTDAGGRHYFDHLDSYTRKPVLRGRRIVVEWAPRSSHRPDHLLDCELMQLAAAMLRGRLPWSYSPPRRGEEITLA